MITLTCSKKGRIGTQVHLCRYTEHHEGACYWRLLGAVPLVVPPPPWLAPAEEPAPDDVSCMVCLWRRDGFKDGPTYPVHRGTMHGISFLFEADILVCDLHRDYADFDGAHPLPTPAEPLGPCNAPSLLTRGGRHVYCQRPAGHEGAHGWQGRAGTVPADEPEGC